MKVRLFGICEKKINRFFSSLISNTNVLCYTLDRWLPKSTLQTLLQIAPFREQICRNFFTIKFSSLPRSAHRWVSETNHRLRGWTIGSCKIFFFFENVKKAVTRRFQMLHRPSDVFFSRSLMIIIKPASTLPTQNQPF